MKYLVMVFLYLMVTHKKISMGDNSVLPNDPSAFTNTVRVLNQVTRPPEEILSDQQGQQERDYFEDLEREEKEWQTSKQEMETW